MAPIIIAKDLYKRYPGFPPVLRGVNVSVEPGELVAVMGPSGCGKSTMLHVLGMLHAPDSGSLEILGTDVLSFTREQTAAFRRGNMGFVMQSNNMFDHSTVFENVEFPLIYEKVPSEERWERVIRALELVRLSSRVHYRSNQLSGGEQQRVAIARAMVNNPKVLLADEPTGALDARTSRVVMENFRSLCHSGGVAMIMVTHDPAMADFCDTIYTLDDGLLTCRKKDESFLTNKDIHSGNILAGPARSMNAAYIVGKFPKPTGITTVQDIIRLHGAGLLSKVYATHGGSLGNLSGGEQYALPLPVRRIGKLRAFAAFRALCKNKKTVTQLWQELPSGERWSSFFTLLKELSYGALLAKWSSEDNIELLYTPDASASLTSTWAASRITGIPFAFGVRTNDLMKKNAALKTALRDAVFVRCDTEHTRGNLLERFPDIIPDKIILLRDGLTLPPPVEEEDSFEKTAETRPILLVAGSLHNDKGISYILHACASLKNLGIPFILRIAGPGVSWRMKFLTWRLGLRKFVTFLGFVPHERMPEEFKNADIFLSVASASKNSCGLPSALQEAMLFGCAVVATDLPGQAEIIHNKENGLLVVQKSSESIVQALCRLLEEPEFTKQLGSRAQTTALTLFDNERESPELQRLFIKGKIS